MKKVWKKIGIAALGAVLCFGASFLAKVPVSRRRSRRPSGASNIGPTIFRRKMKW